MLKIRNKRRAEQGAHATERLACVEASIVALQNEDLLDFADIFRSQIDTPLAKMAAAEMKNAQSVCSFR
ncbi:hypothetical protein [Sphingomonas faeni]|uniref:hypothetical protein n=1 Tax=Sphingomonas faeni TaxID=185950 RepID=UPI0033650791